MNNIDLGADFRKEINNIQAPFKLPMLLTIVDVLLEEIPKARKEHEEFISSSWDRLIELAKGGVENGVN